MARKINKTPEVETNLYTVTLALRGGETLVGQSDTIIGAMEKIETDPKVMGTLSIDFNGKHVEKMFNANVLKRLFGKNASPFIKRNSLSVYSKFLKTGLC